MKKIKIPYFPSGLKFTTPLLIGIGVYSWILGYPAWIIIFVLLTVIILTTHYVTEVNLEKREYRDFVSFLGIPFEEERVKFNKADKIIITKESHSQMLNSRSRSRQLDWASFTGTLIVDGNKTLDLLTKTEKTELIEGLKQFVDLLKVDIEDQTSNRQQP